MPCLSRRSNRAADGVAILLYTRLWRSRLRREQTANRVAALFCGPPTDRVGYDATRETNECEGYEVGSSGVSHGRLILVIWWQDRFRVLSLGHVFFQNKKYLSGKELRCVFGNYLLKVPKVERTFQGIHFFNPSFELNVLFSFFLINKLNFALFFWSWILSLNKYANRHPVLIK